MLPESLPSAEKVLLPSRAYLLSWRDQNLAARRTALEESLELFAEAGDDLAARDMALLGVVCDAMQCVEDFAVLASAWDEPWAGIANYVQATTWDKFKATNFWQEAPKWSNERLDVIAGFAMTDPETKVIEPLLDVLKGEGLEFPDEDAAALDRAREATRTRLRKLIAWLAKDWKQFSPYFLAFKHGGLVLRREDIAVVDDDVELITESTEFHEMSVGVWRRSPRRDDPAVEMTLSPTEIVEYVEQTGRMALDLVTSFLESRSWTLDFLDFDDHGRPVRIRPVQIPWTVWLREQDLQQADWERLGRGPRINWVDDAD